MRRNIYIAKLVKLVCIPVFLTLWTPATGRSRAPGGRGRSPSRWSSWGRRRGCHRRWREGTVAWPRCWAGTASPAAGGRSRTRCPFPGSEHNNIQFFRDFDQQLASVYMHSYIFLLVHCIPLSLGTTSRRGRLAWARSTLESCDRNGEGKSSDRGHFSEGIWVSDLCFGDYLEMRTPAISSNMTRRTKMILQDCWN